MNRRRFSFLMSAVLFATVTAVMPSELLLGADLQQGAQAGGPILQRGDHVVIIGDTFADRLRVYGYVETLVAARLPGFDLTFRNMGWPGDTLTLQPRPLNFGSLDEHLTQQKADVVLACFGMSESFKGPDGAAKFESDLTAFVRHQRTQKFNGKTPPRLVLVSPIFHEPLGHPLPDPKEHNRSLQIYSEAMGRVAKKERVPLVDLFRATQALASAEPTQKLTTGGIHLNEYGYWAVGQIIAESLAPRPQSWRIEIDAAAGRAESTDAGVIDLRADGKGVRFTVSETLLPAPSPPEGHVAPGALAQQQSQLVVKNLKPGQYTLKVGGRTLAKGNHLQWAAGVAVTGAPGHEQMERLRKAVAAKNDLFFQRWRAPNAEYIYGRRRKPYGVQSFPPEMETLDRMIHKRDQHIWKMPKPSLDQILGSVPPGR